MLPLTPGWASAVPTRSGRTGAILRAAERDIPVHQCVMRPGESETEGEGDGFHDRIDESRDEE